MSLTPSAWYPVAAQDDLVPGHVYQTRLGGSSASWGLAIWLAGDGSVNIWEDRCPHRGMRFSLGEIIGDELVCRYHAWRFANGSGQCRFIPAQPGIMPPSAIRAQSWPVAERGGLVWTGLAPEGEPPEPGDGVPLRAIPVNRDAAQVEQAVADFAGAALVVQPLGPGRCVIRGWCALSRLADTDAALEALRRTLEVPC
jgi:phenylpropionate dioxygenase-like ring-hydroxylating dioxygenase large terminal subunit